MNILLKIFVLCFSIQLAAQTFNNFVEVSANLTKANVNDYNPLHVGDVWQYKFTDHMGNLEGYYTTRIAQDSLINGKRYFKKVHWMKPTYISWERNDTLTNCSYMLDFEDIDNDGNTSEEFLLDNYNFPYLNPSDSIYDRNYITYLSYKYSYKNSTFYWEDAKNTRFVGDEKWIVFGDSVNVKVVEYLENFIIESIAEKYGLMSFWRESPSRYLTGAIIDGKQYGILVSVTEEGNQNPVMFRLYQNYPNPFNPTTQISYQLPKNSFVHLVVYNSLGQEVAVLVNQLQSTGQYSVEFNAANLPSGVYIYKLQAGEFSATQKMILAK